MDGESQYCFVIGIKWIVFLLACGCLFVFFSKILHLHQLIVINF